jgi:hypothetical protein
MESYIIRVYRKSSDDEQRVAGLIEMVGASEQKTFQDIASLQSALVDMIRIENNNTQETTQMDRPLPACTSVQ